MAEMPLDTGQTESVSLGNDSKSSFSSDGSDGSDSTRGFYPEANKQTNTPEKGEETDFPTDVQSDIDNINNYDPSEQQSTKSAESSSVDSSTIKHQSDINVKRERDFRLGILHPNLSNLAPLDRALYEQNKYKSTQEEEEWIIDNSNPNNQEPPSKESDSVKTPTSPVQTITASPIVNGTDQFPISSIIQQIPSKSSSRNNNPQYNTVYSSDSTEERHAQPKSARQHIRFASEKMEESDSEASGSSSNKIAGDEHMEDNEDSEYDLSALLEHHSETTTKTNNSHKVTSISNQYSQLAHRDTRSLKDNPLQKLAQKNKTTERKTQPPTTQQPKPSNQPIFNRNNLSTISNPPSSITASDLARTSGDSRKVFSTILQAQYNDKVTNLPLAHASTLFQISQCDPTLVVKSVVDPTLDSIKINTRYPSNQADFNRFMKTVPGPIKFKKTYVYCIIETAYSLGHLKYELKLNDWLNPNNIYLSADKFHLEEVRIVGYIINIHPGYTHRFNLIQEIRNHLQTQLGEPDIIERLKKDGSLPQDTVVSHDNLQTLLPKFDIQVNDAKARNGKGTLSVLALEVTCGESHCSFLREFSRT